MVDAAAIQELTAEAKHEKELRAWALAFNQASRANAPAVAPGPATSPADVLTQLTQLYDDGLLTDGEFDAKRAEVIGRI
jgi:hypothetical protein